MKGWVRDVLRPEPETPVIVTVPRTADDELLIRALFAALPAPDTMWPMSDRVKWFRVAVSIFDLLYPYTNEGEGIELSLCGLWRK